MPIVTVIGALLCTHADVAMLDVTGWLVGWLVGLLVGCGRCIVAKWLDWSVQELTLASANVC